MPPSKPPPWKRKRPSGPRSKLSEHDKQRARRRAARAGRRYPNLIDNMWAAQTATTSAAKPRSKPARARPARRNPTRSRTK